MNSMTGFGRGSASGDGFEIAVEANSVNRKSLETSFSLPKDWQILERPMAERVRGLIARGRVHVSLNVDTAGGSRGLAWDDDQVEATMRRFTALAQRLGCETPRDPDVLLRLVTSMQSDTRLPDVEKAEPVVLEALQLAMEQLVAMRGTEGAALASDLRGRLELMRGLVERIRADAAGRPEQYREMLHARLKQAGLELELSDERVLKEIAIFADRCDISEEITRLESHLQQFQETMGSDLSQGVGRKLEFLLQEINREFNTVGSKANNLDVSRHVIEAKNEIERVREQILNIE